MEDLILVLGPPCSGKSSLADPLGRRLGLPVVSRDAIKELAFERLGWSDGAWSQRVGALSYALIDYFIGALLRGNGSAILESNFSADGLASIAGTLAATGKEAFTVYTHASPETLRTRFLARANDATRRHPGHVDTTRVEDMEQQFRYDLRPLLRRLPGRIMEVDTEERDPGEIITAVLANIRRSGQS